MLLRAVDHFIITAVFKVIIDSFLVNLLIRAILSFVADYNCLQRSSCSPDKLEDVVVLKSS